MLLCVASLAVTIRNVSFARRVKNVELRAALLQPRLETLSCECYALVKRETDRILLASPLYRDPER